MVVLWIKADLNLIGMSLVSTELITGGKDIMICPTKRYKFIFLLDIRFMSRIDKPLRCLIFIWDGDGPERRVGV